MENISQIGIKSIDEAHSCILQQNSELDKARFTKLAKKNCELNQRFRCVYLDF